MIVCGRILFINREEKVMKCRRHSQWRRELFCSLSVDDSKWTGRKAGVSSVSSGSVVAAFSLHWYYVAENDEGILLMNK
jgi:hypothetical protein